MCGIFGFSSPEMGDQRHALLLQSLAIEDEIRGKHSTGLVVVNSHDRRAVIRKKALSGREFVARNLTDFLFEEEYDLAIGHNRLASSGAVNDRNAHPFGLKVGDKWDFACHNGTFDRDIARFLKARDYPVDSEVVLTKVAREIAKGRPETEVFRDIFKKISENEKGNYAILYVAGDTVYAFRNTGRPLHIFETHHLGTWLCSTEEIFRNAYIRLHGLLPPYDQEIKEEFVLKPYKIYAIRNGEVRGEGFILTDDERRELEEKQRERERQERIKVFQGYSSHDSIGRSASAYSRYLFSENQRGHGSGLFDFVDDSCLPEGQLLTEGGDWEDEEFNQLTEQSDDAFLQSLSSQGGEGQQGIEGAIEEEEILDLTGFSAQREREVREEKENEKKARRFGILRRK
jgi:predicted glutamine amidotransferase